MYCRHNTIITLDLIFFESINSIIIFNIHTRAANQLLFCFKSSQWPSGKVLGGSSRINFNIHVRGHISTDYSLWQSEQDWTKEDVLYYFNKYEKADKYNSTYIYVKKYI